MEKEKVTEELVRQNGNQAAAVMADYAGQGEGGGGEGGGGEGGGSTGGATIVLPKELHWVLNSADALYTEYPKAGDVVLVPYYVQSDGIKRLYPVIIESIVPIDEIPEEPSADFNYGTASVLGSFFADGDGASAVDMTINGELAGVHLGIEPYSEVSSDGFVLNLYSVLD